jgi:hypothetical protein
LLGLSAYKIFTCKETWSKKCTGTIHVL